MFSYAFTTARPDCDLTSPDGTATNEGDDDPGSGGGPYAAQQIGGAAALGGDSLGMGSGIGGSPGDGGGNLGLFGEITGKGVQVGMGTIAGFGYG